MKYRYLLLIALLMGLNLYQNLSGQLNADELGRLVQKIIEKYDLPALSVVIFNSENIVMSEIQGVRVMNTDQKASRNDYFHIGSCSKSVLAVIAGKLTEEGKIRWNTPFFEIFPELKNVSRSEYNSITLEDLLLCKAGIKPYTSGNEKYPPADSTKSNPGYEFAKYLIQQPPSAKFSDGKFDFLYSNAGYSMAALMLEKVSHLSYEELIDLHLVKELDIPTFIGFPNTISSNQPWGHLFSKKDTIVFPPDHSYKLNYLIRPAGDLSMSPLDYAKFIQLNLKGLRGEDNYITSDTYRHIHYGFKGFSLGVANGKIAGLNFSGTDGSAGTFFCRAFLVPESDFAFTIMTNAGSGTGRMKSVDRLTMKIVKKHYNWWWKFWM